MAIICRKTGLLFIMNPRTASTAIGHILIHELQGEYIPKDNILDNNGTFVVPRKHSTISQLIGYNLIDSATLGSLLKFTTVRNPFDSLVSLFIKKKHKYQPLLEDTDSWVYKVPGYVEDMIFCRDHSFPEWIEKKFGGSDSVRSYIKHLLISLGLYQNNASNPYFEGVDVILRYECLQEDFNKVLKKAGIDRCLEIPLVNRTGKKADDYRSYYTPRARKLVETVFESQLKKFNYKF